MKQQSNDLQEIAAQLTTVRQSAEAERLAAREEVTNEREKLQEWCNKVITEARSGQDRDKKRIRVLEQEVEAAEAKRRKQCDELRQQADQLERESERNRIDKEHFAAQLKQAIEERSSVSTTVLAGSVASQYFTAD